MIIETVAKRLVGVCRNCKGEYEIRTLSKVDACKTPKLALMIMESNFILECPHCGDKTFLQHPMYFFDVENNIALVYSQYWNQAKKMAEDIVPVPIGKNGKPIKIRTFTQWFDFRSAMIKYYASVKRRVEKAEKEAAKEA